MNPYGTAKAHIDPSIGEFAPSPSAAPGRSGVPAYISVDDAVEAIAGHRYATREECEQAWRKLCQLVIDGSIHPRGCFSDGTTFSPDIDQFYDMADRYFRYAACLRYLELEPRSDPPRGAVGWVDKFRFIKFEGPGSYKVRDSRGVDHPGCNLIFPKAEIDLASKPVEAPPPATSDARLRTQPKRPKAEELLLAMFQGDVPLEKDLPNWELLKKCKGPEWSGISDNTILRAAGRSK